MSSKTNNKLYNATDKQSTNKYEIINSINTNVPNPNNLIVSNSRSSLEKVGIQSTEVFENVNRKYWYRGEIMELVNNPMEELQFCSKVFLEQKIELLEVLTGYETPNRYHVYILDKNGQKKYLFKCKEESTWCCRNCCPSSSRAFEMKMIHIKNANKRVDYKKTIGNISKPFTCAFCCLRRPKMTATFNGENEEQLYLGTVMEDLSCDPSLTIFTENHELKWRVQSKCCQCGYFCRCFSLGKCYEVDFWIYDIYDTTQKPKPIGNIHKVFKGISELITDADAFLLNFPKNSTPNEKLMLIVGVLMIDYRYYEETALCNFSSIL